VNLLTNVFFPPQIRFYWSMRHPNKRCRYICSIADVNGRPEFRVLVQEPAEDDIELRDWTPKAVWQRILEPLQDLRKKNQLVQLFPKYVTGEDLFGLTEPAVVRILESLPGIETLSDYRFKYGRNPLLELPLAINPSGAARTEPKPKHSLTWKKPHTQRTGKFWEFVVKRQMMIELLFFRINQPETSIFACQFASWRSRLSIQQTVCALEELAVQEDEARVAHQRVFGTFQDSRTGLVCGQGFGEEHHGDRVHWRGYSIGAVRIEREAV
jgi:hypothetical protein